MSAQIETNNSAGGSIAMQMPTKSLPLALIAAVVMILLPGPPAYAHFLVDCERDGKHDSSQIQNGVLLSHPPNDEWMHKGELHTGPDWQDCYQDLYVATNVVDNYVSTYADFYCRVTHADCSSYQKVGNSAYWRKCSYDTAGWRGANVGSGEWYGVKVQDSTWWKYNCHWDHTKIRARTFAKIEFRDGHFTSGWNYSKVHGAL